MIVQEGESQDRVHQKGIRVGEGNDFGLVEGHAAIRADREGGAKLKLGEKFRFDIWEVG